MSREQSIRAIISAVTRFQEEVAEVLAAKAIEAEKARRWIVSNVHADALMEHEEHMSHAMEMHERIIEVLEGLTKMETALGTQLKLLIGQENATGGMGAGGMGPHSGLGGGMGDMFGGMDGR